MLATQPEAGQDDLVDGATVGLDRGLAAAGLESAQDAAFDDGRQVLVRERAAGEDSQPPVAIGPGGPHHLVMGDPQALTVEVLGGAQAIEQQPAGADPARGGHRQDLVDAAAVLAAGRHLAHDPAQRGVDLERRPAGLLARRDRYRQRVDLELRGRGRRQRDSHAQH